MNDVNPYQSPLRPASSRRNIPLHLTLGLVATVLCTPLTIAIAGLLSYKVGHVFFKLATNSRPTTDPVIILTFLGIFLTPPAVTAYGMIYLISAIFRTIVERRGRENAVNKPGDGER